jgi:hypothetical protein
MANVICRPELHHATSREQYDQFHAGMQEFGLERTITRGEKVFHLPTGEYLGVNLSTSLPLLALKITTLAIRITGNQCKLTLIPVTNPAEIYILGLEEQESYAPYLTPAPGDFMGLAAFARSHPAPTGYEALAGIGTTLPPSLQSSFLTALSRKS